MIKKLQFSLSRTAVVLIIALLICMSLTIFYLCLAEKGKIEKNFALEADTLTERVTNGLAYPLWILNDFYINKTIRLEMKNRHIKGILVFKKDGSYVTGIVKDDRGVSKAYRSAQASLGLMADSPIVSKKAIVMNQITIGYVYLYIRDDHLKKEIKSRLFSIITQGSLFTILLLIVIFAVIQPTVLKTLHLYSRLHKLNATKDKLFSIIAHDLRSPLVSISQCLSYMHIHKKQFSENEYKELFQDTINTVDNTYKLVDNLIEWARTQKGEISAVPLKLNIHEQIDQTIKLLGVKAQHKGITIQNRVDPEAAVFADPGLFLLITRNIISNGVKFTKPGGKICINAEEKRKHTLITIKDNGVGMSQSEINKLFRIEKSFSKRGTQNERGTGLGLILCKEFMDSHKGQISLETVREKGTTFSLLFPSP